MLSQIETIKFGYDWNARTDQKGGKLWKSRFFLRALQNGYTVTDATTGRESRLFEGMMRGEWEEMMAQL